MLVSLIIPSRNNLKYLKWSYESIRRSYTSDQVEICVADDASEDGTWKWCLQIQSQDPGFKCIQNPGPDRLGHTILYDKLIKEVATGEVVGIYHADMFLLPGSIEEILSLIKPKTVISLTRIEPPLHPAGYEKVIADFGTEPKFFNQDTILEWFSEHYLPTVKDKITVGVFAPWFILKQDFIESEGHDILFAPQSKEDSDIFNRFQLQGFSFIQTWKGAVYHLTCRGSRFNPTITTPGVNSSEWEIQNKISERNFIRKWGTVPLHDNYMKPIIPPKYNIGIIFKGESLKLLRTIEPWASNVYILSQMQSVVDEYIEHEQPKTLFNLKERIQVVKDLDSIKKNGILVHIDENTFTQEEFMFLQQLPLLIEKFSKEEQYTLPETLTNEKRTIRIEVNELQEEERNYIFYKGL